MLLPASLTILIVRLILPEFDELGAILQAGILLAVLVGVVGASHTARRTRRAWTWLALGQASFLLGDVLYFAEHGYSLKLPVAWTVCYIAFYAFVCIGLMTQPARPLTRSMRLRIELDVALIVVAAAMIFGILMFTVIRAHFAFDSLLLLYPMMDIVLVCTLALMLLRQVVPSPAQFTYGIGLLLLTAADVLTVIDQLRILSSLATHDLPRIVTLLYGMCSAVMVSAALLEQRHARWRGVQVPVGSGMRTKLRKIAPFWVEFLVPYGWIIAAIAVCVAYYSHPDTSLMHSGELFFVIGCMGLILTISVARQWLLLKENSALAMRQARLLHASHLLARPYDLRDISAHILEAADGFVTSDEAYLYLLRQNQDMHVTGTLARHDRSMVRLEMPEARELVACLESEQPAVLSVHLDTGMSAHGAAVMSNLLERTRKRMWPDRQHPSVRAWIIVPLRMDERLMGALCVGSADEAWEPFGHLDALAAFARQGAAAIDNAHMRQRRTEMAATAERSRLSRELHDSVLQAIFGCSLGLRTAQHYVEDKNTAAHEALSYSLRLVEGAISEMRALIFELRPETLANEGLFVALLKQAQSLCDRHSINAVVHSDGSEPLLSYAAKEMFYRIAIEALQNVIKHARARNVQIELHETVERVCMTINDDGIGFDTTLDYKGHLGLVSMQERAMQVGAAFMLTSAPGSGTRVEVCMRVEDGHAYAPA